MIVDDGHGQHPYDAEYCNPNCKPIGEIDMADMRVREYSTEALRQAERSFTDYLRDDHPTADFRKPEDVTQARRDLANVITELQRRGEREHPLRGFLDDIKRAQRK